MIIQNCQFQLVRIEAQLHRVLVDVFFCLCIYATFLCNVKNYARWGYCIKRIGRAQESHGGQTDNSVAARANAGKTDILTTGKLFFSRYTRIFVTFT